MATDGDDSKQASKRRGLIVRRTDVQGTAGSRKVVQIPAEQMRSRQSLIRIVFRSPHRLAEVPEPTDPLVGQMKVSKPAVAQGGWDELELFDVSRHSSEILDELRTDAE